MYVLITGGAGYIGSHIALSLLQKNHHVIVLDNLCNSSPLALTRVETLSGKKITFHQGDIRRRAVLNQVFNHQPIDCQKASPLCFKPGKITDKYEQLAMAKLIFSTSYLEYCSADNIYATDLITLQLRQNIQPFLQQIAAIYSSQGKMVGFVNAAPIQDYDHIKVEYGYRQEVFPLDVAYDSFVNQHRQPDDFFICSVALLPEEQGKGYFNQILSQLVEQATQRKMRRIILCVWQSSPASMIYRKKGFKVIGSMKQEVARFNDEIVFMALTL